MAVEKDDAICLDAINQAKRLLSSDAAVAIDSLKTLADQFLADGHIIPALEARRQQCYAHIALLELDIATSTTEQFLEEATTASDQKYIGIAEMYLGIIALEGGNHEHAIELFEDALLIAKELDDADLMSRVRMNLGCAFHHMERYQDAINSYQAATETMDVTVAIGFYNMAIAYAMLGYTKLIRGEDAAVEIICSEEYIAKGWHCDQIDDVTKLYIRCCEGLIWALRGETEYGLRTLQEVEFECKSHTMSGFESEVWITRCRIHKFSKNWSELKHCSSESLKVFREKGILRDYCQVLALSALADANLGNFEEAYTDLREAFDLVRDRVGRQTNQQAKFLEVKLEVQKSKFDQQVLRMRNQFLVERNRVLEQEVKIDRLTGVLNRRGIEEVLVKVAAERHFTVGLLDIDFFKRVNDQFGHGIGDEVLKQFASLIVNSTVQPIYVGRWGGEEFLIVLTSREKSIVANEAESIVQEVKSFNWQSIHEGLTLTTSLGLAQHRAGTDIYATIKVADENLYEAKRTGRDRWIAERQDLAA